MYSLFSKSLKTQKATFKLTFKALSKLYTGWVSDRVYKKLFLGESASLISNQIKSTFVDKDHNFNWLTEHEIVVLIKKF